VSLLRNVLWVVACATGLAAAGCAGPQPRNPLAAGDNNGSWAQASQSASVSPPAVGPAAASLQKTISGLADPLRFAPRVIPASDPVSLASQPQHVGPDLHFHAAQVYESQGNLGAALTYYQKALQVDANDYATLLACGRLHDRQGEFRQAATYYRRAIAAQPGKPAAWNDLGMCCARNGDSQAALTALENAAAAQPLDPLYRNNLAAVLADQQRYEEAFRQLAAVHTQSAAYYNLGCLLVERQQPGLARQHFAAALQFDPHMMTARDMLARLEALAPNPTQTTVPTIAGVVPRGPM